MMAILTDSSSTNFTERFSNGTVEGETRNAPLNVHFVIFLEKRFFEKRGLNSMKSASTLFSNGFLEKRFLKSEVSMLRTGFYLGYLRGRSFPPKNIVIITVYE